MLTPLVVAVIRRGKLPLLPYLLALAISANLGSVATLVGNPQNMIIGHMSHIPFSEFARSLAPAAIVGMAINFVCQFWFSQCVALGCDQPGTSSRSEARSRSVRDRLHRFGVDLRLFFAGLNLAWTALAGAALVMVLARRDTHEVLKLVDWHLLVFFAALFVVVEGLSDTGLPDAIYRHLQPMFGAHATAQAWNLTWFSVAGSNIFSNVPFVLVAGKWIPHFADLS